MTQIFYAHMNKIKIKRKKKKTTPQPALESYHSRTNFSCSSCSCGRRTTGTPHHNSAESL
jgi:hypothetical protein